MNIKNYTIAILVLLGFLVFNAPKAYAVKIIPPRLVIKPDEKIQHMFVKNSSNTEESYRFGWKHMAMDKEGNVLNLDRLGLENAPPGYKNLDDFVRFSPRRTTLKPGQTQRVTFIIKRSNELESGEYRSHFLIQREPKTNKQNAENEQAMEQQASPAVAVGVSVSRAVPIYLLHGETNASLEFVSAKIIKNANKQQKQQPDHLLEFKVKKTGNRSVIGSARVYCTSGGKEIEIGKTSKTFAVYAESETREEQLAVELPAQKCASYRLDIKGHPDDILANQQLVNQSF